MDTLGYSIDTLYTFANMQAINACILRYDFSFLWQNSGNNKNIYYIIIKEGLKKIILNKVDVGNLGQNIMYNISSSQDICYDNDMYIPIYIKLFLYMFTNVHAHSYTYLRCVFCIAWVVWLLKEFLVVIHMHTHKYYVNNYYFQDII